MPRKVHGRVERIHRLHVPAAVMPAVAQLRRQHEQAGALQEDFHLEHADGNQRVEDLAARDVGVMSSVPDLGPHAGVVLPVLGDARRVVFQQKRLRPRTHHGRIMLPFP